MPEQRVGPVLEQVIRTVAEVVTGEGLVIETIGTLDPHLEVTEVEASVEEGVANRTPLESLPAITNAFQSLPATSP